MVTYFG